MFCGERLHYDICFWLFRNAAVGQLTFAPTPLGYEALFEAETSGLIRAIAGSRKEVMRSVMQFDETTGRLRPLLFQELSTDDRREIDKILTFDYTDNSYTIAITVNKQRVLYRTKELPEGTAEDLLTFYYNFRMGHYGPAKPGMSVQADLLMSVRTSHLSIMLHDYENGRRCADYYYAVVTMEKNLTQAGSGRVSGRLSRDLIPLYGVIEDAYYFGDLTVSLTKRDAPGTP